MSRLATRRDGQPEEAILVLGCLLRGAEDEGTAVRGGGGSYRGGERISHDLDRAGNLSSGRVPDYRFGHRQLMKLRVGGKGKREVVARYGSRVRCRGRVKPRSGHQHRGHGDGDDRGRSGDQEQTVAPAKPGGWDPQRAELSRLDGVSHAHELVTQQVLDGGHSLRLLREGTGQCGQATGGGGPDGALTDAKRRRGAGHAQVQVVAQGEDLALPPGQRPEGVDELAALLERDRGVRAVRGRGAIRPSCRRATSRRRSTDRLPFSTAVRA